MNNAEKEIFEIYTEDILPNRFQPRLTFDEQSLKELANSIKEHGIIQPLVVRKLGDKYEIIAGERRYKAANLIGLQKVPAIIMNLDDNKSAEIAIVENIQRKEMSALEEAKSFKNLLDRGYLTQEQLASRMGKSQSMISNKLRLLNLDEEVQEALMKEKISERHARSLLSIKDKEEQKQMLKTILEKKLTVKQTDDTIKHKFSNQEEPEQKINEQIQLNPQQNIINNIQQEDEIFIDRPTDIDFEKIKTDAIDINPKASHTLNFDELLRPKTKEENNTDNNEVINKIQEEPKNKFLIDFDDEELDFFDAEVEEKMPETPFEIAQKMIQNNIKELEKLGFKVIKEEFDFEKMYQIIIKIDKK